MTKKRHLHIILIAVLAAGLACAPLYAPAHPTTSEDVASEVVRLINDERRAMGLEPFVVNDQLVWMAQVRSDDMVASGYAGHHPPDGHPTLHSLTEQLGYDRTQRPVENIALVPIPDGCLDSVAVRAVSAWRDSPGHWHWITTHHYWITGVGVSVGDDHVIVTQLFWGASGFTPQQALEYNREADAGTR